MEKLGFQSKGTTKMEKYTFLEDEVECKEYICTKDSFLEKNKEGE